MRLGTRQPGPVSARRSIGGWLEAGLDVAALLFMPVLVLAPRGIAVLEAVAGAIALGLVVARRPQPAGSFAPFAAPAALLGALLLWGLVSALWSVDGLRSLVLDAQLAGIFAAALALIAARRLIAAPQRLTVCFLVGLTLAMTLAGIELASNGRLIGHWVTRRFELPQLNHASVAMAILLLPASAALLQQRQTTLSLLLAAAVALTVYELVGTAAKLALVAGFGMAVLFYGFGRTAARAAVIVTALAILAAPAIFPQLVRIPAVVDTVDAAGDHVQESGVHRLLIWSFAGKRIAERPLLGWGLDSSRAIPGGTVQIRPAQTWMPLHPHNAALQVWLELGAPGAAILTLLTILLWLRLAGSAWPRLYAAAAAGSLVVALAAGLSTYGLWQEWWLGTLAFALFLIVVMAQTAHPATAAGAVPAKAQLAE
jgi:exopolysaccharide production protein ExoQ